MANRTKVKPDTAMKARIDAALRDGNSLGKVASDEGVRRQTLQIALLNEGIVVQEKRTWILVKQSDGTPLFGNSVQETAAA